MGKNKYTFQHNDGYTLVTFADSTGGAWYNLIRNKQMNLEEIGKWTITQTITRPAVESEKTIELMTKETLIATFEAYIIACNPKMSNYVREQMLNQLSIMPIDKCLEKTFDYVRFNIQY